VKDDHRAATGVLPSQSAMQSEIDELLISGRAGTMAEAEGKFLDAHLEDVAELAQCLSDEELAATNWIAERTCSAGAPAP
jgi:hypothetical protein